MSTDRVLDIAALWVIWSVILPASIFLVVYSRRNWRATPEGRAIMYRTAAIDLVLIMGLVRFFVPDWPTWALVVRLLAYIAVAWAFWWMLTLLLRTPRV